MNFAVLVQQISQKALIHAFPSLSPIENPGLLEVSPATQEKFGHYQFNGAMKLTKILGANPQQIAEKMIASLKQLEEANQWFNQIEIAGPGFINFSFKPDFIIESLKTQLQDTYLGVTPPANPSTVIIDFSSPNIAKEMHVGHLRSTIIGDCLARILAFLGHRVLRFNHIGDWGTQFGMLIAYLKKMVPNITHPEMPNIELNQLVAYYQAAKKLFDEDLNFKKQAQQEVVALQSGGEIEKRIWQHICEISRKAYEEIYHILDVNLVERGESFYNPFLAPLIAELDKRHLLQVSDGAKCVFLDGFVNREGDPLPLILQKKDGGFNYATTDLATLKHRVQIENGTWLIYVTDAGQSQHFQMVFKAGEEAGFYKPTDIRIDHVPFGLVLKPDGKKFQTRSGETERLIDLLHTAIEFSKQKLKEHNPEISEAELNQSAKILGIDSIKYADLSTNRMSDYIFSYDKMLKFEGNTAAFILYAYVRIQSIQRKLNINPIDLTKHLESVQTTAIQLEEPVEINLALLVCQFSEVLENVARELLPNRLTDYLYRLAEKFHVFFHQCRVEGSSNQTSRLLLCQAVSQVLLKGIELLGLKPLEKM